MSAQKCPRMVTIVLVLKGRGFSRGVQNGWTVEQAFPALAQSVWSRPSGLRQEAYEVHGL